MNRNKTGNQEVTSSFGEEVRAFVPNPLPPDPPIFWTEALLEKKENAALSLGRLDSISQFLPDPALLLYNYIRKEAVLSSQIEGTQSSLSDLLAYENTGSPGAPLEDVQEVSSYVAAMEYGLKRLREGFPLCLRLIREIHEVLLSQGRGSHKSPGEFRKTQNWIGGTRPGNAVYVPPPPHLLMNCLGSLENYLQNIPIKAPVLTKAALTHVQFETIHPFLDGNGRVGRLLITLILCHDQAIQSPMLYLSLYFKKNRQQYYELLQRVRTKGDWESWLDFFFQGVIETAQDGVKTSQNILELFKRDEQKVASLGRLTATATKALHLLQKYPLISANRLIEFLGLAPSAVNKTLANLISLGLVRETTGRKRNRLFAYSEYLDLLTRE